MWKELDKKDCFTKIINGEIDLDTDEVVTVGFIDTGFVENLGSTEIDAMKFLINCEDIKLFQKVVDNQSEL